jgi:polygalacturonase
LSQARCGCGINFNSAYTRKQKGVTFRNICFRNVSMRNVASPFTISGGHGEATSEIENIVLDGLYAEAFAPIRVKGNRKNAARNIVLRNMEITVVPNPVKLGSADDYPSTLFEFERVDGVTLDSVRVRWTTSNPNWKRTLHAADVTNLDIADNCLLPGPETDTSAAQPAAAGDA